MSSQQLQEEMNNWKQFQGTELGGLMARLYAGSNKPVVNYPKPKTKTFQPDKQFHPLGNKIGARDPRLSTRTDAKVNVPKVAHSKSSEQIHPVQLIPRRRNEVTIMKEVCDIKMRQEHYRPAHIQPISSDQEKDRLNQIFTFKGGKCLPEHLSYPVSEAPFEVKERMRELDRIDEVRMKRGLAPKQLHNQRSNLKSSNISETEMLAEQITQEINERREYLESMQASGALSVVDENRITGEIKYRIKELNKLEM